MINKCNVCGELRNCNLYLTADGRRISICPSCLVWGADSISRDARQAHKEKRLIADKEALSKAKKRGGGRK